MTSGGGWDESAAAWIADMGERGDYARAQVLDPVMLERVRAKRYERALDVGCGEGRFCRMLRAAGIAATGIDPTQALLARAKALDPEGDYRSGRAEELAFPDGAFDLVVSYLTLIDIPDAPRAIAEMARVLRPGGTLLIANLTGFATASAGGRFERYLDERAEWVSWRGIRIRNWHRPLGSYMSWLLAAGLRLTFFSEPEPRGGSTPAIEKYRRFPYLLVMEWEKPARGEAV